jgi:hypothetical protein
MRYLWRQPVRLDNRKLVGVLGAEPHTPLDVAVERTLEGLHCLPATDRQAQTPAPSIASIAAALSGQLNK